MQYFNDDDQAMDQALAARLAKLRTMPVDTTKLDKALRALLGPVPSRQGVFFMRPLRAIAASALLMSALAAAIMLYASNGPVQAEAAQMARVHEDILSGRIPVMQVDSIESANRMLNSQSPGAPALPQMPESHVMACCMKSVHHKKMACVLLTEAGVPITLAVASASDMKLSQAPVTSHNGIDYRVQRVGELGMVMTERDGKWLCLIGQTSNEKLMDVAAQVRF